MNEGGKNRVLVCPLGWGLGHASRLIPIIKQLQESGHEVIAAGDRLQVLYIASFFSDIRTLEFPSFKVKFSKGSSQIIPILGIALRLPFHTIREHFAVSRIVKDYSITEIISDNRYGLWCKGAKSILITHQLRVLFPKPFKFLETIGVLLTRFYAEKFDECWVPDFQGEENLAGELSHPSKFPRNVKYIGSLSRFKGIEVPQGQIGWDLVGISSGPSPHREILIDLIANLGLKNNLKTLIIKGNPAEGSETYDLNGVFYAGHLNDLEFAVAVKSTKYLICRAGYSTIMDLNALKVNCILVPTPGQTEQEYLSSYLSSKGLYRTYKQSDLVNLDLSTIK